MTKYREDMIKIVAECPGMFSDHPGITPKVLPLRASPTCLREKEMAMEGCVVGLLGERKRHPNISQVRADPTFLCKRGLSATSRWTVRFYNFGHNTQLELPLEQSFSTRADCPRTLGGPSALCLVGIPPSYPKLSDCTDDPRTICSP